MYLFKHGGSIRGATEVFQVAVSLLSFTCHFFSIVPEFLPQGRFILDHYYVPLYFMLQAASEDGDLTDLALYLSELIHLL